MFRGREVSGSGPSGSRAVVQFLGSAFKRLVNDLADLGHLVDPDEGIHLGQQRRQFVPEALGQATGND
jgi:hypothetical protein